MCCTGHARLCHAERKPSGFCSTATINSALYPRLSSAASAAPQLRTCYCAVLPKSQSEQRKARVPEDDKRYRRLDMAEQHAWKARQTFVNNIAKGEAGVDLTRACLSVAAEDDALVSHSTVELPIRAFEARLEALSGEFARLHLPALGPVPRPHQQLRAVEDFLFKQKAFVLPTTGIQPGCRVDHPGVWEKPGNAYLHDALISRTATSATLAVVLSAVLQNLLSQGCIDFVVRISVKDFTRLPIAEIIPGMTRASVQTPDGKIVNTCAYEVLIEILRYLKRAYWPFPWQTETDRHLSEHWVGGSGFTGAAQVFVQGEQNAALKAISRTARHRQDRGIWTSTGGGDLRRALASAERLAILCGDLLPVERRDAAVLLAHAGQPEQALAELQAYMHSAAFQHGSAADAALSRQLHESLSQLASASIPSPLCIDSARRTPQPHVSDERRLPLTW